MTKEQVIGYSSSSIICLLLLLFLSFITLNTRLNAGNSGSKGEEGVLVNYGTVNWAAGTFEPRLDEVHAEDAFPIVPQENPAIIIQTTDQTVAVKIPDKQPIEQSDKSAGQKQAINKQMSGLFNTSGTGTSASRNEGTAGFDSGNQGNPERNAATGSHSGVGSFDLRGRSLVDGGLQRPEYAIQEEGSIVVEITVDPRGNVIFAEVRLKGTNIENALMRKSALEAARKTKFNSIDEKQNQIGSITYRYSLK